MMTGFQVVNGTPTPREVIEQQNIKKKKKKKKRKISREEKNTEKKNECHVPQDFHQRNKVFLFFSEKNERLPCETVTATSSQFFNKEVMRVHREMEEAG